MEIAYPFHLDAGGRIASATYDEHIRDMIEQLLFTSPGERVNRPDFGCGLLNYVFMPGSEEGVGALRLTVQVAIERWLGQRIRLESVDIRHEEAELILTIEYIVLRHGSRRRSQFRRKA